MKFENKLVSFYTGKRRGDVEINDLNKRFIDDFTAYLSLKYAFNTVNKTLSLLRAVINRAIEDEIRTKPLKISVHYVEKEKVYLKQEEIQALINTDVPKLQRVKNTFLLLIYTGQRKSDYRQIINPDNRTGDRILITQQKTGIPLCIPIHPAARQILNSGVFLKEIKSNFGIIIQTLCEIAGIDEKINITKTVKGKQITEIKPKYELITPHTARRTLVSILKQQGFTNSQIMSITGHKSVQTLESYDRTTQREYADTVMEQWNREFINSQPE